MPQRIQRKRTKGWKMPEGAVYVGRQTKWGNGYTIVGGPLNGFSVLNEHDDICGRSYTLAGARTIAVELFRAALSAPRAEWSRCEIAADLAGRDLACWCPLDQPCHADVLLEIANYGKPA